MPQRKAFPLRIDGRLYAALRRWADDEFRSMNGQIEYLLHNSLRQAGRLEPEHGPPSAGSGQEAADERKTPRQDQR